MEKVEHGFPKPVIWGCAGLVILLGFVALPALIWILMFRWVSWSRWIVIPLCSVGTLGYFLATWMALKWLSGGAQAEEAMLSLTPPVATEQTPTPGAAAEQAYREVLAEEQDPEVREVIEEALEETAGVDRKRAGA